MMFSGAKNDVRVRTFCQAGLNILDYFSYPRKSVEGGSRIEDRGTINRWEKLPVGQELPLVQTVMMDSANA